MVDVAVGTGDVGLEGLGFCFFCVDNTLV